jgi:hypothetical protein
MLAVDWDLEKCDSDTLFLMHAKKRVFVLERWIFEPSNHDYPSFKRHQPQGVAWTKKKISPTIDQHRLVTPAVHNKN